MTCIEKGLVALGVKGNIVNTRDTYTKPGLNFSDNGKLFFITDRSEDFSPDEDLKWVTEKIHYYLLRLLEESDCEIEEDVELVSSEIGRFNAMVSEYQNNLASLTTRQQNILTEFTAKLSDFNSKWDTMLKIWTQKVQSYTTEMQLLKSDITDLQNQYNQSFYTKSVEEEKDKQE